ncbi:hypothetical protein CL630_00660 [bacterium]|nr:hypothetical protein [bacterium]|tara:strand:- start:17952 stop:18896 length:945 start_codon:yes stop_codon:yes gene_type:complete
MHKIQESERISDIEKIWGAPLNDLFCKWHWKENLKHSEIGMKVGIPRPTVTRWFRQFDIPTQSCTRFTNLNLLNTGTIKTPPAKPKIQKPFPWKWSKDFFKKWSPEMAYVLGFLFADGHVVTNPRGSCYIGFTSTDKEIIEKIKHTLHSNHTIGIRRKNNPNWKDQYVLQIGSKSVVQYLKRFGIVQNKSLAIKFPKNIPENMLRHFIRGYFDGDGCVYFGQYWAKDRNKTKQTLQCRFTSGSRLLLVGLKTRLSSYTQGGTLYQKPKGGHELAYSVHDSLALCKLMYNNVSNNLFLSRKYKIFQEAVCYYNRV